MNKKILIITFALTLRFSLMLSVFNAAAAPGVNKLVESIVTTNALSLNLGDYYLGGLSFQQDAIATYNGWQYVAYYNSNRQVSVARRQLPSGSWQSLTLTDYTQSVDDAHNIISLGIAPSDGTIHLAFDHHSDPLHYRRSVTGLATNPGSYSWTASLFGAVTSQLVPGQSVSNVTYPRFVTTPSGNLQFAVRIGTSGSGENHLWEYTNSWASLGMFIDNPIGGNAYLNGFHYDQNGRLYVSWVKRETPDASTNHDLFYMYSDNNGRTWRNNNGSIIGTTGSDPVTIEEPQVWSIPQNSGLINQEAQTIDHQGRIHVLLRRDSGGTNYQYHYWRGSNGTWHETNTGVTTKWWARRSKIAVDSNNNVYALTPNLRIASASASTNWTDWALVNTADDNRFHSEPLYDWYRLYDGDGVLSVMYQLNNSGSLRVLDFELNSSGSGEEWTFCANEGEFCSFSGTQEVRYGANGSYNYGTFTNGVDCTNSVFGDPIQGTVKQCHYREPDATPTPTNTPTPSGSNPISQANWSLQYVDSEETVGEDGAATNAFDGNTGTIWHTQWQGGSPGHPHEIQINLGGEYSVGGFRYLPRQDGNENGRISQYEFYVSTSPSNWGSAVATGTFANSSSEKEMTFAAKTGQYVRLVALSEVNGNAWTSASEINVLGTSTGGATATPTNTPVGPTDTPTPTPTPTNTPTPTPTATTSGGGGPISQANWSLQYVDSEETVGEDGAATNAFDGNTGTIWHTQWQGGSPGHPHEIQINLGASYDVNGFRYLPRQDGNQNGRISQYAFYVSTSPSNWGSAVASGTFVNNSSEKEVTFTAKTGQYVRLVALSEVNGNAWTSAAEINVLGTSTGGPTPTPTNTPSSSTYQAEDANVGGGAAVESNHSGYNGSGFVNFPSSGGFVEYQNVDGGSGGSRTLQFRFALGSSSARTGQLTVNGNSQNITFQPNGSWDSWSTQNVTVSLNSGSSNTIRLESTGQDLANIDQVTVN